MEAATQVVFLNDVDFIVSGGLTNPEQHAAVVQIVRAKMALVLPALEPLEDVVGISRGINQTLQAVYGEISFLFWNSFNFCNPWISADQLINM